jgi:hypothetical protein
VNKEKINQFIDTNKSIICRNYCEYQIGEPPNWIKEIEHFLRQT